MKGEDNLTRRDCLRLGVAGASLGLAEGLALDSTAAQPAVERDDGYRGIWYANQPTKDKHRYKYSGGFATYPQQHIPIAYYSRAANKTFFCYGGTVRDKRELLHMVSYFDHATGTVPRPVILLNKKTSDAHDNPTLMLDDSGHLWIFSNAHGKSRPSYIHRSRRPHSIDGFERVLTTNFSYSQPWHLPGRGWLFLHTRYSPGRNLFWMTSPDGVKWGEPQPLARVEMGHYQVSWLDGTRIGTAFNYHPRPGGLNARTNLYYLETADAGKTWRSADGTVVKTPVTEVKNAALVRDYQSEKLLVYLKDVQFDARGRPVLLYLTSGGYEPGPRNDPRTWHTARWTGKRWEIRPFTASDHNYDFGSLYLEDGTWRIIAPTAAGPVPHGTGGEVVMWTSRDEGKSWRIVRQLTRASKFNHTYVRRPVHAHPDFYALWADGDVLAPSGSSLYFTNRAGERVWKLPERMAKDTARPEVAW
ncbi:MAG: BNR repeat-containing protein [Gemmataceae bacterium]|nr:BNR repeat-containing protein [Gemmataceae bacterium]